MFLEHHWFSTPVPADQPTEANVIFGTTGGKVRIGSGAGPERWAVQSLALPKPVMSASPMLQTIVPDPTAGGSFIAPSVLIGDQQWARGLLRDVWVFDHAARDRLTEELERLRVRQPDLWQWVPGADRRPRPWLCGVQAACVTALEALVKEPDLRRRLRYCEPCDRPWWPPINDRGRPRNACPDCGGPMLSRAARSTRH